MMRFAVTSPKGERREYACDIDLCTVGKGDDNLMVVSGWSVGRKHATFTREADGVHVQDHGALAGTRVMGRKVTTWGPMFPGDQVQISDHVIEVLDVSTAAADAPSEPRSAPVEAPMPAPAASTQTEPVAATPGTAPAAALAPTLAAEPSATQSAEVSAALKALHERLIRQMDLRRVDINSQSEEELRDGTRALLRDLVADYGDLPAGLSAEQAIQQVLNEVIGLGALEDLIADDAVTEIMVNAPDEIYIEKGGVLQLSPISFTGPQAVLQAIERIVAPLGRRIDESSPMVDARLKDGSRVNAVIPPLALKGPCITIRKFSKKKLVGEDLVEFGSLTPAMLRFLRTVVEQKANVLISGGTGSGKTTLLNVLSNYIPRNERVVTVEDAAELQLSQPNLVSLESRPPNAEGRGQVEIRDLVRNCLRMRPDRIVVGECRGGEALDMLTAMNTGHDGSLTTLHANTPRDCLSRIEVMVMMAGMDLPVRAIREQIASAIQFIVQQTRFSCGTRKITHVTEVTGMEGDVIQLQDIFVYAQSGFDGHGKVKGQHVACGQIPEFCEELLSRGLQVDMGLFEPNKVV
jgi:pilus assembly protein CpaF